MIGLQFSRKIRSAQNLVDNTRRFDNRDGQMGDESRQK